VLETLFEVYKFEKILYKVTGAANNNKVPLPMMAKKGKSPGMNLFGGNFLNKLGTDLNNKIYNE